MFATFSLAACGGKATSEARPGTIAADASEAGSGDGGLAVVGGRVDAALAPGCPATPPESGAACSTPGLACSYTSDFDPCGSHTCDSNRKWQGSLSQLGCSLPESLVCPTAKTPLVGSALPVDKSCVVDADCASVTFQTDCCGNTLAYGVNTDSVPAASQAAKTCGRSFPGCGCPEGPTLAETGAPDAATFGEKIDAFCASGICKTRYR